MYFHNRSKNYNCPNVYVNGEQIQNVTDFKYLGVTLDPTLSFKKHVKQMCQSLKFNIATFKCIRNSLTLEAAKLFFNAMIMSRFYYCITCWSQANKSTLKPLESIHKQALKILDRRTWQHHHCHILQKYTLLNFENVQRLANIRLVHRIIHNTAPAPLKKFVQLTSQVTTRATRSSSRQQCSIPKRKTTFAQSAFSYSAIKEWNNLPTEIKNLTSYSTFTCELKKWLWSGQTCQH